MLPDYFLKLHYYIRGLACWQGQIFRIKSLYSPSLILSEIEEVCNLGDDGTLFHFTRAPKLATHDVEITPGLVSISKQEIAADYVLIIVRLKKQLDEEAG